MGDFMLPHTAIRVKTLNVNNKILLGIEIELPNSPPLVVIRGDKGFIMCGFLDLTIAEKFKLVAAKVRGVNSVEEMLEKEIEEASIEAIKLGLKPGVRVKEVLNQL